MKLNGKLSAHVYGQDGKIIAPLQEGKYETWTNSWECLGLHSELENKDLVLEVSVSDAVLGEVRDGKYLGAILYTKDWPASRQGREAWVTPQLRGLVFEGFKTFCTHIDWRRNQFGNFNTDSSSNNLCVVEVGKNGFQTHQFCVVTDGEYVFLVYNLTYHGQMFKRDGELFVPDLQRREIVSGNTLDALQWRVDPFKLKEYNPAYQCWAERIDFKQLGEGEAVVIAMMTPIGSFLLRDRDCRHITSNIRDISVPAGVCPFPTIGLVCSGVITRADQRLVMDEIEFYADFEDRYAEMSFVPKSGGSIIPDMGVPEKTVIVRGRRPASRRRARMILPESLNLTELEQAVWGNGSV